MDNAYCTLTSTEESRAGAMACLEALRAIQKIAEGDVPDTTKVGWWYQQDSAVAVMLCAAGNPDGFMAGFIAALAEYVKNELSSVGYYPDGWEKPEAAMTDEEKIASRSRFDEEVARTIENNDATEEDKEQAYQEAAEQARESISLMLTSAEGFRSSCARYVTKPARAMVRSEDGYSFEEKTAEKIDQSITALGEIIRGGDVVFSPAIHEQARNDCVADAFGKHRYIWADELEMNAYIQRFMNELNSPVDCKAEAEPA